MSQQFKKPKTVYNFVLADRELAAKGGCYTFSAYTDKDGVFGIPGATVRYIQGRDAEGREKPKYYKLDQSFYNFVVREGEKDDTGKSQFDFLSNAPMCEGSVNGDYIGEGEDRIQVGVVFKLMNTDKDAETAMTAARRKVEAESSAMSIDDETLTEIAAHYGWFDPAGDLLRHKVYQIAGKRPLEYFEILNSGDRAIRSIIRKALSTGIFSKKGEVILWSGTVIGSNEDDAVSKLMREKDVLEALQKKMGLTNELKIKAKPGPKTSIATK